MVKRMKRHSLLSSRLIGSTLRLTTLSAVAIWMAGCSHRLEEQAVAFVPPEQTYEERHPIEIEKGRATLFLQAPYAGHGLDVYQKENIRHFIALWRNDAIGKLRVSGNNREALADVRDLLIERVVPYRAVELGRYDAGQPGVKLSFARYVAEAPECGRWRHDLTKEPSNGEYDNFGCAMQHDLAKMVANPRDFVLPRDQTDWANDQRRDFIYRAFEKGSATESVTTSDDKKNQISNVAPN